MATSRGTAINIGEAVRGGLRLRAREAVALAYEACAQLDTGRAMKLPTSMDELSLSTRGLVVLPRNSEPEVAHTAVAGLLESLLGAVTDEVLSVPPALRSLPTRLREASTETPIVRDLLSILRWHLRQDSRQVLQELLARMTPAAVRTEMPLRDGPAVRRPPWRNPVLSTSEASTIPAARRRRIRVWPFVTVALVTFGLSAYAGYQDVTWPGTASPTSPAVALPMDEAGVNLAPARDQPHPLSLSVRGGAFSPSFAVQPRTLLFHAVQDTTGQLYTATLDDHGAPSGITVLLDETARNYHARLSPDGKWIALQLATYRSPVPGRMVRTPAVSPDGRAIVFQVFGEGVWLLDLATGKMQRLLDDSSAEEFAWDPSGRRIAYHSRRDGEWRIWLLTL